MASTTVLTRHSKDSPYQLDPEQTLKASKALLQHIQAETRRIEKVSTKKNLLAKDLADDTDADADDANGEGDAAIWLTLATKQHIVDKNRLKPTRIAVPHSLNKSSDLRICLITADPQRAVKNAVADPAFPFHLKRRIAKIIGYTKLKARYKTFESRRQLLSDHDVFLADDRIITRLPSTLGSVFYKATLKRPIPVSIVSPDKGKKDGDKKAPKAKDGPGPVVKPQTLARDVEKAIDAIPVSLRPGTLVAVRVGLLGFTPQQLTDNIDAVVQALVDKHVAKGWRNVKAIHIKGVKSLAVPIWLADQLWTDKQDIMQHEVLPEPQGEDEEDLKRKRNPATVKGPQAGQRKKRKVEGADEDEQATKRALTEARKRKLSAQKARVFGEGI